MRLLERLRVLALAMAASGVTMLLSACAGSGEGEVGATALTLESVVDEDLTARTRIAHLGRLWELEASGQATHDAVREQLKRVAWRRGDWWEIRMAAVEALLEDEPNLDDTRNMLRLMLPTEPSPDLTLAVGEIAAARGWTDLAPAFVRRWSRVDPQAVDTERVEYRALRAMFPDRPLEDVVFDVFMDQDLRTPTLLDDEARQARHRDDAWALLRRLDHDGARTIELLRATDVGADDELVLQLRDAARVLGVVPDTSAEMEWLRRVMAPEAQEYREACAAVVSRLSPEQRVGLRLRHLPTLLYLSRHEPGRLSMSKSALVERIDDVLSTRKRYARSRGQGGEMLSDESIGRFRDEVTWADAQVILHGAELVERPQLAEWIFQQAERDRQDTSTEHGGVISHTSDGDIAVEFFEPRITQRRGDRQFTAPPDMILVSDRSPFHYHLHAQEYRNTEYAGPSHQDEMYALEQARSCLVFTFVDSDTMNVDYYQPGRVTIDLGVIRRPGSR